MAAVQVGIEVRQARRHHAREQTVLHFNNADGLPHRCGNRSHLETDKTAADNGETLALSQR